MTATTLLILTTILPSIGPAPTSSAVRQATLAELLSGSWVGTWTRGGQTDAEASLLYGDLSLPMKPAWCLPLRIEDEGQGRFRGKIGGQHGCLR